eukprot:sb/3468269/
MATSTTSLPSQWDDVFDNFPLETVREVCNACNNFTFDVNFGDIAAMENDESVAMVTDVMQQKQSARRNRKKIGRVNSWHGTGSPVTRRRARAISLREGSCEQRSQRVVSRPSSRRCNSSSDCYSTPDPLEAVLPSFSPVTTCYSPVSCSPLPLGCSPLIPGCSPLLPSSSPLLTSSLRGTEVFRCDVYRVMVLCSSWGSGTGWAGITFLTSCIVQGSEKDLKEPPTYGLPPPPTSDQQWSKCEVWKDDHLAYFYQSLRIPFLFIKS